MTRTYQVVLILVTSLGLSSLRATAADQKPQRVELTTADGVELSARYQSGPMGNKSPAVLIMDGIGENRRPQVCDAIATDLQKQGCATLCLDFRGNGGSTGVTESFWETATNRNLVRGYKAKDAPDRIAFTDFKSGYTRTLLNDIAAARAFLERRNDAGECNSGHILVVGLREGASLGAMWVATEWSRYRVTGGFNTRLAPSPEGRDILGCVWVEPELELDRQKVPMSDYIKRAVGKRTTYVGLIHAINDTPLAKLTQQCSDTLNKKNGAVFKATALSVGNDGNATDHDSLRTSVSELVTLMRKVQEPPPWDDRNFADKRYAWSLTGGGVVIAKDEDERTLKVVPYERILPR